MGESSFKAEPSMPQRDHKSPTACEQTGAFGAGAHPCEFAITTHQVERSSVTVIGRTSEISVDGNESNELFSKRSTTWLTHQTPNHTGFIESLCRTNLFSVKAGRGSHSNFYCYPAAAFIVQSFLTLFLKYPGFKHWTSRAHALAPVLKQIHHFQIHDGSNISDKSHHFQIHPVGSDPLFLFDDSQIRPMIPWSNCSIGSVPLATRNVTMGSPKRFAICMKHMKPIGTRINMEYIGKHRNTIIPRHVTCN